MSKLQSVELQWLLTAAFIQNCFINEDNSFSRVGISPCLGSSTSINIALEYTILFYQPSYEAAAFCMVRASYSIQFEIVLFLW